MTRARPNRNVMLAGVSGVVLLLSLFSPWYGATVSIDGVSRSATVTAWRALATNHVVLLLLALAAVGLVLFQSSGAVGVRGVQIASRALVAVGLLAAIIVLYRLLSVPTNGPVPPGVHVIREQGGIMALVAALGITAGGARNSLQGRRRRRVLEVRAQCPALPDLKDRSR